MGWATWRALARRCAPVPCWAIHFVGATITAVRAKQRALDDEERSTACNRLGRKSREHGVDRTPYKGDRKISFVSYHTRAISMNIVRATAWTLHDAAQKAKGCLCGKRAGSPAALG